MENEPGTGAQNAGTPPAGNLENNAIISESAHSSRHGAPRALAGACWGSLFSAAAIFAIPFGVFVTPIMTDTGWSRETATGGLGIAVAFIALCSPLAGRLADRIGIRRFSILSFPAFGLGLMVLGLFSHSAPFFLLTAALLGIMASGQTAVPYSKLIVGWFDARRGIAFGTMLALMGLGSAVSPPFSAFLISEFGWRYAYICLGVIVAVVGTIGAWLLVFDPPARISRKSTEVLDEGKGVGEALRSKTFWILTLSLFFAVVAIAGIPAVLPSILVDRGMTAMDAALVVSVFGVSILFTRLFVGFLLDYIWAPYVTMGALAAPVIGLLMLANTQSHEVAIISAMLLGIGFGSEMDVLGYMVSRAFGRRHYGQIFGISFAVFAAANGAGPFGFAVAQRLFGVGPALAAAAGLIILSICLLFLLREGDFPYANKSAKRLSLRKVGPAPTKGE